MKRVILVVLAVAALSTSAKGETGALSGSGEGEDEASACQSAKSDIEFRFALAKQEHDEAGAITKFEPCMCSFRPEMARSPAESHRTWKCTTNAEYKTEE